MNEVRVYVDGIFDLFHCGHLRMLKQAKNLSGHGKVHLIAGVVGDAIATVGIAIVNADECAKKKDYKRTPIISEAERAEIVSGVKWVDEVVVPAPLEITREYVEKHRIDLIVHGFANEKDKDNFMKRHKEPLEMNIVKELPYTYGVSTTDIIERCAKHKNGA